LLEPQRLREAGEAGRRLFIIEHRFRSSRTGLAHKVSLNPFDPNSFLTCGEDGIGLRVRRRNERDQGRRDVPRLLRTKGVAQVGDPRPVVDGDTVGSPLPEGTSTSMTTASSECQTPNRCSTLPRARFRTQPASPAWTTRAKGSSWRPTARTTSTCSTRLLARGLSVMFTANRLPSIVMRLHLCRLAIFSDPWWWMDLVLGAHMLLL